MLFGKKIVTVIKVEGLKCPHCKAKVETAIKAIDGVKKAVASLETNEVTITSKKPIDKKQMKKLMHGLSNFYGVYKEHIYMIPAIYVPELEEFKKIIESKVGPIENTFE